MHLGRPQPSRRLPQPPSPRVIKKSVKRQPLGPTNRTVHPRPPQLNSEELSLDQVLVLIPSTWVTGWLLWAHRRMGAGRFGRHSESNGNTTTVQHTGETTPGWGVCGRQAWGCRSGLQQGLSRGSRPPSGAEGRGTPNGPRKLKGKGTQPGPWSHGC